MLASVVGAPAFFPCPPWAPRAAVGPAVQAVRLHRPSVAVPLGRGLPPRAAGRFGSPGPRAAVPAGAAVCAGSGPGPEPGAGRPGDDGSAGRAGGPVNGAWCRWGPGPSCVMAGSDAFPWGAWPRDAAADTHKQAGRQSTALTGASSCSCHVTKRFRILATLKQGTKSMYSNTSGYAHLGLRLDCGKGFKRQ